MSTKVSICKSCIYCRWLFFCSLVTGIVGLFSRRLWCFGMYGLSGFHSAYIFRLSRHLIPFFRRQSLYHRHDETINTGDLLRRQIFLIHSVNARAFPPSFQTPWLLSHSPDDPWNHLSYDDIVVLFSMRTIGSCLARLILCRRSTNWRFFQRLQRIPWRNIYCVFHHNVEIIETLRVRCRIKRLSHCSPESKSTSVQIVKIMKSSKHWNRKRNQYFTPF